MFRNLVKNSSLLLMQYAVSSLVPLLLVPHVVRTILVSMLSAISQSLSKGECTRPSLLKMASS